MIDFRFVSASVFVFGWAAFAGQAYAADDHAGHGGKAVQASVSGESHEDHGHAEGAHDHTAPQQSKGYVKSLEHYDIPKITLIDQNARPVRIDKLLAEDRPTLVQFIFTSCSTICPIMGAVFGGAQQDIANIAPNYRMISVSIDPEYDTPDTLREFASKQNAGKDWIFLTGKESDVTELVKAFDALNLGDNKMYHQPFTFIRWHDGDEWVRIRGLLGVSNLADEFSRART